MNNKHGRGGKREGSGRPSLYKGERKAIKLSLLTEAIDKISKLSEDTSISKSDIINRLVMENLKD